MAGKSPLVTMLDIWKPPSLGLSITLSGALQVQFVAIPKPFMGGRTVPPESPGSKNGKLRCSKCPNHVCFEWLCVVPVSHWVDDCQSCRTVLTIPQPETRPFWMIRLAHNHLSKSHVFSTIHPCISLRMYIYNYI